MPSSVYTELPESPPKPKIAARQVRARVADWIGRLERLYAQLDHWVEDMPDATASRGQIEQAVEPLMKQFKVPARRVPTYTVCVERERRIAFVPSAIWIVGANGRVDISTNARQHILFDLGGRDGSPSEWRLVVDDANKLIIPFNKSTFLGLLRERR